MRLWHKDLIPYLDDKRLIKQHSECCAFRGKMWNRGNYPGIPKDYGIEHLLKYHKMIMDEMKKRGFKYDEKWLDCQERGTLPPWDPYIPRPIYDWEVYKGAHTDEYLQSCKEVIKSRGDKI